MLAPPEIAAQWLPINFVDAFGDSTGTGAQSAPVRSVLPMRSPYEDTTARIMVNCDRAWLRFSRSPNLTGGSIQSGYTRYYVTVRVDGEDAGLWDVLQLWGGEDLNFVDAGEIEARGEAIAALSAGATFAVSLPWYRGSAAFSWSLEGASDLIRASCD